jgi:hypothetical protein
MLESFSQFNSNGQAILLNLDFPPGFDAQQQEILSFINSPGRRGISWTHDNKVIRIEDQIVSVAGLPSADRQFVVAVFLGNCVQFPLPNNAVVYNLDGSLHSILKLPPFITPVIIKRLEFLKQPNPPMSYAGRKKDWLGFTGFSWRKEGSAVINAATIEFEDGTFEIRKLDISTGQFGESLAHGLAMYSKY